MWTIDMIDVCRCLAKEGCSARQIAMALGTKTRNAVIGKMMRLGIKLGNPVTTNGGRTFKLPRRRKEKINGSFLSLPTRKFSLGKIEIKREAGVEFKDLTSQQCHWPFGDRDFYFCGRPKSNGSSYCVHHEYKSRWHPR